MPYLLFRFRTSFAGDRLDSGSVLAVAAGYGRWLLLALVVWTSFAFLPARALDKDVGLLQLGHTAWRLQDGVFDSSPTSAAQTSDGYLWIGTLTGLLRFDGVRFVPSAQTDGKLPSQAVISLLAERDGGLLIGSKSGLSRLKANRIESIGADEARVNAIVADPNGTVWISRSRNRAGSKPLCSLRRVELKCYGREEGLDYDYATTTTTDLLGRVWVGSGSSLTLFSPGGSKTFKPKGLETTEGLFGIGATAVGPDNSIWAGFANASPGNELQYLADGIWTSVPLTRSSTRIRVTSLLFDKSHALWVGTDDQGIFRVADGRVDHMTANDGLSGDEVTGVFEDRERSVWVTTTQGLDRFRDTPVITYLKRDGRLRDFTGSVLAARDGTVYVGGDSRLESLSAGVWAAFDSSHGLPDGLVTCLLEDASGRLWVGVEGGLFVRKNGRFAEIRRPDGGRIGAVLGLSEEPSGTIAAVVLGKPNRLTLFRGDVVTEDIAVSSPTRIAGDPSGGFWLSNDDGIKQYKNGSFSAAVAYPADLIAQSRTLKVSEILALADSTRYFATSSGLLAMRGPSERQLRRLPLPCGRVYSVIEDASKGLWLSADCGFLEITANDLERWWQTPGGPLTTRRFDAKDGARMVDGQFQPRASKDARGRLWFAGSSGLQMIDVAKRLRNETVPPVHIEAFVADQTAYPVAASPQLPSRTRGIEIDYTALSLVMPERVQFRYRLEGYENAWQEAGVRRQAFYTGLGPGSYRFTVLATNNDGVWNSEGATLAFAIRPAWFQTAWFRLLGFLAVAGALLSAYRFRIRQVAGAIAARFEERMAERSRIAREMHDTLLQGLQGLIFRLEVLRQRTPDCTTQSELGQALDKADEMLGEGRDRIQDLRLPVDFSLPSAISQFVDDLRSSNDKVDVAFMLVGTSVSLRPSIGDEVFLVCREALLNAQRHAEASRIDVSLIYKSGGLTVQVADNGRGLRSSPPGDQVESKHFGIESMRGRAEVIGAHFEIGSSATGGTQVSLFVPARRAFQRSARAGWRFWKAN